MLHHFVRGLTLMANGPSIAYLVGGSLIGMLLGVIPGLGGAVILTIVLAFVYHIDLTGTLCLFLATQAGSYFSASITSILLNTPAHPEAFAVTFDGFPMAQRGEAGRALGISAASTCIGGIIGCAVLVGFIQIINYLPNVFHPPEMVALILLAMLLVGTLGTDQISKALVSTGIALMIASVGNDPITGVERFSFGAVALYSGVSVVGIFLGLFAIPQMVLTFGTASAIARQSMMGEDIGDVAPVTLQKGFGKQVMQGVAETFRYRLLLLRSALIGVVTGIVPGIGGFAANFMSYGIAQQMSKDPKRFGTGIPEGIIAPEGSSLSKEAGGMIPILGIGIPGGVGGVLFLGALAIKGVPSGFGLTTAYPDLAYETVWIIALGGIIGTVAGVLTAPLLAKVTRVPGPALLPYIVSVSALGAFAASTVFFTVTEMVVFAVVGFVMRRLRYSLAAFGIGVVLGQTLEQNIFLTHTVFHGVSFFTRPLTDALVLITIVVLVTKARQLRKAARESAPPLDIEDPLERAEALRRYDLRRHPYPFLALFVTSFTALFATAFTIYGIVSYDTHSALLPAIGGSLTAAVSFYRLPSEVMAYRRYRRDKALVSEALRSAGEVSPEPVSASATIGGGGVATLLGDGSSLPIEPTEDEAPRFPPIQDKSWGRSGQYTRELVGFIWFFALIAGCYLFGFVIALPAFCVLFGMTAIRRVIPSWRGRLIYSVIAAGLMWAVTFEVLRILNLQDGSMVHF